MMKTRFVNRLTPMTLMGKAVEKSIEELARTVLAKDFHVNGEPAKKVRACITFPFACWSKQ